MTSGPAGVTNLPTAAAPGPSAVGGLLGLVLSVLDALGETGVGLAMAAESVVPPVPSEAVLPLAGFLARSGSMSLPLVIVAATLGSVAGAVVLYALGAVVGAERLRRWSERVPGTSAREFDRAMRWFDRRGSWAVLLGRCVPLVRSLVSVPAGIARMSLWRFVGLTTLGSLAWNSVFVTAGYLLGSRWEQVATVTDRLTWVLVAAVAALLVRAVVRRVRAHRTGLQGRDAQRSKTDSSEGMRAR